MLRLCGALLVLQVVFALPQVHYSGNAIASLGSRGKDHPSISPEAVTVTLASLLSNKAPIPVSADVSRQVEQILEPDLFSRPTSVLSIAIAGSNIGLENSKASLAVDDERYDNVASQLLAAVASVSLTAQSLVKQVHLDYTSLQGCNSACLEESLKNALVSTGATYASGAGALKGIVSFEGVDVPISSTAGLLWATELATLYQTAQDVAQEHVRSMQQGSAHAGRVLLECSLVSLQAVEQAVGQDSSQYKAATKITMKLVQIVQQILSDAYDNRMVTQVALLGTVPKPFDSVSGLVQWQEAHRRKLLQSLPASNSLTNGQWSERATAVTSFLVLLAGAFGGVQCLTHMNFKRDTLLFGSAKSD